MCNLFEKYNSFNYCFNTNSVFGQTLQLGATFFFEALPEREPVQFRNITGDVGSNDGINKWFAPPDFKWNYYTKNALTIQAE